jgi:hypothetical protein
MRRLNKMSFEEIIGYNLREDGTAFTIFEDSQPDRVHKARQLVSNAIDSSSRKTIIELGCSAGDISGWFSEDHLVIGFEVVPSAAKAAFERYPMMKVVMKAVEEVDPIPCDVLVLCEFLEHIVDPISLVRAWMPVAKNVVIGHPLVGYESDPEIGHIWAYEDQDFLDWFPLGGHEMVEAYKFQMGGYRMAIGRGRRLG